MSRHGASTPFATSGMSRNYDYPPATDSAAPLASSTSNPIFYPPIPRTTSPFQRDLSQPNRRERSSLFETIRRREDHRLNNLAAPMPPRRRQSSRRSTDQSSRDDSASLPEYQATSSQSNHAAQNERMREHLRRRRRERESETPSIFASLPEAHRQFDQTTDSPDTGASHIITSPHPVPRTTRLEPDTEHTSGRLKRRKLEHSFEELPAFKGFSYGHFGQVVPGRLKMEIVSCDGGEYSEGPDSVLHCPDNVLRNDKSVYCTKSSECNLLLRHQGETPFCLEKIDIRAPRKGFTAPLQEGLIFVGMSADEIIDQSSRYRISQHESRRRFSLSSEGTPDEEPLTLMQSLQDHGVWEGSRQHQHERAQADFDRAERDQAWTRRRMERMHVSRQDAPARLETTTNENCDWLLQDHTDPTADADSDSPYAINPPTDDDASDLDEESSIAVIADRMRRDARARDETDFDDDYSSQWQDNTRNGYIRAFRRSEPRHMWPTADSEGLTLRPSAKFFMEKNRITVKFPTPLSAKFLLLKFYSSRPQGNIDVQSVVTYGFAGPRYFPACEMR